MFVRLNFDPFFLFRDGPVSIYFAKCKFQELYRPLLLTMPLIEPCLERQRG